MINPWKSPASGEITNGGRPWRRGTVVNIPLVLESSPGLSVTDLVISGGVLPPGLILNSGQKTIQGTIGILPKGQTSYPVVIRATYIVSEVIKTFDLCIIWKVDPVDEEQQWITTSELPINLGTINRGSNVNIQLGINNPDGDPLTFRVTGVQMNQSNSFAGLPKGLSVDSFGRIIGSPTITSNPPGSYYFRIYARDADDMVANPHHEGQPRTSDQVYFLTVLPGIVLDARLSDVVRWETPPGLLGSTYETYPSHFAIKASPQYEVQGGNSLETQAIRYTLTQSSKSLPKGLTLDPLTGLLLGNCPYVSSNITYEFTVEARVVFVSNDTGSIRASSIASERTFSIMVRNIFNVDAVTTLSVNVPADARRKIAKWIWGNFPELRSPQEQQSNQLTILGPQNLFRPTDTNFGRRAEYTVMIASGLNYKKDKPLQEQLKDYHHPTKLRLGSIQTAKAKSPEGVYLYDVVYLTVLDPMDGAAGFDATGREQLLSRVPNQQGQYSGIPQWNLKPGDAHYFPNSVRNLRLDLQSNTNRLDWSEQNQSAATRGYGLVGSEGLPLWMTCEQETGKTSSKLGYVCCVEVAYVRPGSGATVVKSLTRAGINSDIEGTTIVVDRYLLLSNGTITSTFDFNDVLNTVTTFDGLENTATPTLQPTVFDAVLQSESKYYKFPPGDK